MFPRQRGSIFSYEQCVILRQDQRQHRGYAEAGVVVSPEHDDGQKLESLESLALKAVRRSVRCQLVRNVPSRTVPTWVVPDRTGPVTESLDR